MSGVLQSANLGQEYGESWEILRKDSAVGGNLMLIYTKGLHGSCVGHVYVLGYRCWPLLCASTWIQILSGKQWRVMMSWKMFES
jgi:hypothetical protein